MQVLFYKRKINPENDIVQWDLYHTIEDGGLIHFNRGNTQIQVTTDNFIKFYSIN